MKSFNTARYIALLKYDWVVERRRVMLTLLIATAIYAALGIMYYGSQSLLDFHEGSHPHLPTAMALFCLSYMKYVALAMVFVVTSMLHRKFTNPPSATAYLTLPGSNFEKWAVMVSDYAIGAVAVWVLYFVLFYLTMFLGWLRTPDLDWAQNAIGLLFGSEHQMDQVLAMFNTRSSDVHLSDILAEGGPVALMFNAGVLMQPFFAIFELGLYVVLNMCFRTNGQLKSVAVFFGGSVVLTIVCIVFLVSFTVNNSEMSSDEFQQMLYSFFEVITYALYCAPLLAAAMWTLFYRQVCRKQAK